MGTFVDLYQFLQSYEADSIVEWLGDKNWKGKEKQESLSRLFFGLKILTRLQKYTPCKGNFNLRRISEHTNFKDIFYDDKNRPISLKDRGDKSDFHGKIEDKNIILASTSKNLDKENIGKFDLRDIQQIHATKYKNYELHVCVCVRDKNQTLEMVKRSEACNEDLKSLFLKETTTVIDWNDLDKAYKNFKEIFQNKSIKDIIDESKQPIIFKMHQRYSIHKTMDLKSKKEKEILWGHIQRSGKSFIIAGSIIEDSNKKDKCNYLVITPAPNETISQYISVFDCFQLKDFNVIYLNGDNKEPEITSKNIVICSKQFLQTKLEKQKPIPWLKKMSFEMRFVDESHHGVTTKLAKDILKMYGKNSFTVQITATYSKPTKDYNIPKKNWILWDLEDVNICKKINDDEKRNRLIEKHGEIIENFLTDYSDEEIIQEYSKYPELFLLTRSINEETIDSVIKETQDSDYGYSLKSLFLLKQNNVEHIEEFQNEEEILKMWYTIFGKRNKRGVPDSEYPDKDVFMKKAEDIFRNPEFLTNNNEPMVVMAFLPQNNIEKISNATVSLLEKNNVVPEYEIVCINSMEKGDPKNRIESAVSKAKDSKKKVLVLSGKQCSLGVTIKQCDIVLLLNNSNSFDMIYQMMFRCMTERKDKKSGIVIDLNIRRCLEVVVSEYASLLNPELHPKEAICYLLKSRIINLNGNDWISSFGKCDKRLQDLCDRVYKYCSSNTQKILSCLLDRLKDKEPELESKDLNFVNSFFTGKYSPKKITVKEDGIEKEKIKDGIEKEKVDKKSPDLEEKREDEPEEIKKINFMDIIKHLIPLICILTIRNEETILKNMYKNIREEEKLHSVLINQTSIWWGKIVKSESIEKLISLYIKYMDKNKDVEKIIRTVKELFIQNKGNRRGLSGAIDSYLVPQELEKKTNAEVSTPFNLRQEMLNKIPDEFWESIKKVFEPCAGKGGFILDIIDRFMNGLEKNIPDEKERYRTIVEECLYFSDINSTNIFICKLLIDPYDEYKLNYNEGNTLELNIKNKWDIDGFDAVIGNPPYQVQVGPRKSQPIWNLFTKKNLDNLSENGYLLFVHPSGWRSPCGIFRDVYDKIMSKNLIYLNMNDFKKGQEVFNVGTNFDYYLVKNNNNKQPIKIVDIYDKEYKLDLSKWSFIPSGGFELYEKVLALNKEDKVSIMHGYSTYETRKKWVSKTKSEEFKYPCCYTITIKDGMKCFYSSEKKGHFDIPKVIWSNGLGTYPIIDENGKYGLTQFSYAIIDDKENLNNIKLSLENTNFIKLMEYVKFTNNKYNHKVIALLKKDFWKEFI